MVFTISGALDSVTSKIKSFKQTPLERRAAEATSNENWGVANSELIELARLTSEYSSYATIMKEVWAGITDKREKWRRIYKSLVLLEYCVKYGAERSADEARSELYKIRPLQEFKFMEEGRDRGSGIREKSKEIAELITNPEQLRAERAKAREGKEKYVGISSNAAGGQTIVGATGYVDSGERRPSTPTETHGVSRLEALREKERLKNDAGKLATKTASNNAAFSVKKPPVSSASSSKPAARIVQRRTSSSSESDSSSDSSVAPTKPHRIAEDLIDFDSPSPPTYTPPTPVVPVYTQPAPVQAPMVNPYMQQPNPYMQPVNPGTVPYAQPYTGGSPYMQTGNPYPGSSPSYVQPGPNPYAQSVGANPYIQAGNPYPQQPVANPYVQPSNPYVPQATSSPYTHAGPSAPAYGGTPGYNPYAAQTSSAPPPSSNPFAAFNVANMDISSESSSADHHNIAVQKSVAVIVKVSGGQSFTVQVPNRNTCIGDIKILAESSSRIPRGAQRIFYKGKVLKDSDTLADKDVPDSATLFMVKNSAVVASLPAPSSGEAPAATAPASPVPCFGQCGFYGSPALENYCSKCFRDMKERKIREEDEAKERAETEAAEALKPIVIEDREDQKEKNKCWKCTKKIGLTGVRCRCGYVFCASHRYAESHDCDYDYKANERRKLTKQNPLVQADKLTEKA